MTVKTYGSHMLVESSTEGVVIEYHRQKLQVVCIMKAIKLFARLLLFSKVINTVGL